MLEREEQMNFKPLFPGWKLWLIALSKIWSALSSLFFALPKKQFNSRSSTKKYPATTTNTLKSKEKWTAKKGLFLRSCWKDKWLFGYIYRLGALRVLLEVASKASKVLLYRGNTGNTFSPESSLVDRQKPFHPCFLDCKCHEIECQVTISEFEEPRGETFIVDMSSSSRIGSGKIIKSRSGEPTNANTVYISLYRTGKYVQYYIPNVYWLLRNARDAV